ncbi:hypothetical protein TSAR_000417 [Trichomalopsis sarcophagae]|uniref:Uncharacterized protein n=1 Tax=Trichomalopsis sarcophagae TaxID=543379 RepID=A0A232EWG1_9HYME|nr:hypothetical protein TSAR_000417 [Trichomalopsis sarcophagae]
MSKRKLVTPAAQLSCSSSFVAGDTQSPTSLVQSAHRRLQYSQLPVRISSKRSISSQPQQGKLASSLRKFTPKRGASEKRSDDAASTAKFVAAAASSGSPSARKSLSLSDLTPVCNVGLGDFDLGELRLESGSNSARLMEDNNSSERRTEETLSVEGCNLMTWPLSSNHRLHQETTESKAASVVCRTLAINALRRRRAEVAKLKSEFAQQIDLLQLQIVVLRRLLDNENARVVSLAGELHKAKAQSDELAKERDSLKIEKESAESEAQRQRELSEKRSVSEENLRNELRSVRDQLDALDKQISKDREKLLKLREDKKILLEKVSANDALVARADKAEALLEDAETKLVERIALADSLQEELVRVSDSLEQSEAELRKMEEENAMLEERLRKSEETCRVLRSRAEDLESELFNQESNIKHMLASYAAAKAEVLELQEQLVRRSQESCWSSKVLQLAGSFVRAPAVIFRTLSFFLTGIPLIL